jgi:uracil-DNA glycosylase
MGHGTPAHAVGLSFWVAAEVRPLPGSILSIHNIHRELTTDGDPTPRTQQVVLLLNRATRGRPLIPILWGRDARAPRPLLGGLPSIKSAHPSPVSAARGFFGSRPFSRANALPTRQGGAPEDRRLP